MIELQTNRYTLPALLAGIAALFSLSLWGGFVALNATAALGFAFTGGTIIGFGVLTWWLLFSRLPAAQAKAQPKRLSPAVRQLLALLTAGSALLLMLGLAWDEVWHRMYGVPIGEDFFWRPHILMYLSFGLVTAFAFGGLMVINRNPGSFRQKFRAEPLLGLLVLSSAFMLVSLPVDPIWHQIYGVDLTAWSLPHLVMFGSAGVIFIIGSAIQISVIPKQGWRIGFGLREALAAFSLAMGMLIMLILLVVEWDGARTELGQMAPVFYQRPQWLFPVLLVAGTLFFGTLGLHLTKRVGMATVVGLVMLVSRGIMIVMFDGAATGMTVRPQLMALIPLVMLDMVVLARMQQADSPHTARLASVIASVVGLAGVLFVISQWYVFPIVDGGFMIAAFVFGLPLCLVVCWYGHQIGQVLRHIGGSEGVDLAAARAMLLRGAVGVAGMLSFTVWFLATATPPIS